ncbi:uncharacterized protein LOC128225071 [Mya arenaria]|uniref:uncharacterized protein LOC128225071 n=1 Tax=Mya arenaria TaxID=6604 RepID=UPI0022E495F4|nr:uncharacterized protein LOC128225071 [Mya arenaria]
MEMSTLFEDSFVETFDVISSTASSIQVGWELREANITLVRQFQVHYQKVASDYLQYGPLLHASARDFKVGNLVADTYYKVCLVVFGSNKMDYRQCTEASTTNWQLPISVGSSIGALLALSVIVLIVLLSRCKFSSRNGGKKSKSSTRYDTMTSMYHDNQSTIHGNEYDFVSEFDDEALYKVPLDASMQTSRSRLPDTAVHKGLCRGHMHLNSNRNSQHRHSLGRIQFSHPHHVIRKSCAHSIQGYCRGCDSQESCSPLKAYPKRSPFTRQDLKLDENISPIDCTCMPYTRITRSLSLNNYSLTRADVTMPEQDVSSHTAEYFTLIDEIPNIPSSKTSLKPNISATVSATTQSTNEKRTLISDIDFDSADLSKYGASGGVSTSNWQNNINDVDETN